jgi:hypothetical protein
VSVGNVNPIDLEIRESMGVFGALQTSVQESDKSVTSRTGGLFILSLMATRILAKETVEK